MSNFHKLQIVSRAGWQREPWSLTSVRGSMRERLGSGVWFADDRHGAKRHRGYLPHRWRARRPRGHRALSRAIGDRSADCRRGTGSREGRPGLHSCSEGHSHGRPLLQLKLNIYFVSFHLISLLLFYGSFLFNHRTYCRIHIYVYGVNIRITPPVVYIILIHFIFTI